jgi:hypothetical protein
LKVVIASVKITADSSHSAVVEGLSNIAYSFIAYTPIPDTAAGRVEGLEAVNDLVCERCVDCNMKYE